MPSMDTRLWVSGWHNSRHAMVKENTLYMEIARTRCNHCPTCSGRIRMVESRLQGSATPWRFVHLDGGMYLAVEPTQMPAEVGNYFSNLLGLQISRC